MAALILPAATAAELVESQGADVFVWRDYRCPRCGHCDTYRTVFDAKIVPVHCGRSMIAGRLRLGADRANIEIDLTLDKNEPWRVGTWAQRRGWILANHPDWKDVHQIWVSGIGRLLGSEFLGLVGKAGGAWWYDVGPGMPTETKMGSVPARVPTVTCTCEDCESDGCPCPSDGCPDECMCACDFIWRDHDPGLRQAACVAVEAFG